MGKLFRQIFKEDIKKVIAWMLSPSLIAAVGALLYNRTNFRPVALVIFVSMAVMTFAPLVSLASLVDNDNARFYGKKAAFYSSLPVNSEKVTGARLINYLIMGFVIGIFSLFNFLTFSVPDESGLEPLDILRAIGQSIDFNIFISIIKFAVILVLFYAIFILIIMAATTLGASRPFNKMGKIGGVILFAGMFLFQGYIYVKFINVLGNTTLIKFKEYSKGTATFSINMLDLNWSSFAIIVLILGAFALAYFALTNYFHKEKISVD